MKKLFAERLAIWPSIVQAVEAGIPMGEALEIPVPKHSRVKAPAVRLMRNLGRLVEPTGRPYHIYHRRDYVYIEPAKAFRPVRACTCGAKFLTNGGFKRHHDSGAHERNLELGEMLQSDCVRDIEVAKEIGISRERVRQLAKSIGLPPGRERRRACTLARRAARPAPAWLEELQGILEPMGFTVERRRAPRSHRIIVNGALCVVGKMVRRWWQFRPHTSVREHMQLRTPTPKDYEFALLKSPYGWFVFPQSVLPKKMTVFVWGDLALPGTNHTRHFWRAYLGRWDLLDTKK